MKPREIMKARTMSQITTSPKPLRESPMPRVPDTAVAPMPIMATAPMGSGARMIPAMVVTKMANRWRPFFQSVWRLASAASALAWACGSGAGALRSGATRGAALGAPAWPQNVLALGAGTKAGRPKNNAAPRRRVNRAFMGLAPCHLVGTWLMIVSWSG